jgi:hypothetical protein
MLCSVMRKGEDVILESCLRSRTWAIVESIEIGFSFSCIT